MLKCSALATMFATLVTFTVVTPGTAEEPHTPLRAGIIGLTTSHVGAFTNAINNPDATGPLADVEIVRLAEEANVPCLDRVARP